MIWDFFTHRRKLESATDELKAAVFISQAAKRRSVQSSDNLWNSLTHTGNMKLYKLMKAVVDER